VLQSKKTSYDQFLYSFEGMTCPQNIFSDLARIPIPEPNSNTTTVIEHKHYSSLLKGSLNSL
jgi:hypothetical protein